MSPGPTVVALEYDSAWVVILAVSLVTLVAAGLLRRLIGRPGGFSSGVLLLLPLALPLVAAFAYEHAVLPEISVLVPAGSALTNDSESLFRLLLVADGHGSDFTVWALAGSAGSWLLVFGASVSSFMLLRRAAGKVVLGRLVRASQPLDFDHFAAVTGMVRRLSARADLRNPPAVRLLPPGSVGALAIGGRNSKILLSRDIITSLEPAELEAVIGHEIAHLKTHDAQLVAVAGFLRDLVAWNPFAHIAYRKLASNRELEADRRAAELVRDPLVVASGLVKVCELMSKTALRRRAALAFLRPGARIKRRVDALIRLADGGVASLRPTTHIPYAMAVLLAAVLGLQAGERLTSSDASGLAIMFGSPEVARTQRWPGVDAWEARRPADLRTPRAGRQKAKHGRPTKDVTRRAPAYSRAVFSVRNRDLVDWKRLMTDVGRRRGLNPSVLFSKLPDMEAVPVVSDEGPAPFGIYRVQRLP